MNIKFSTSFLSFLMLLGLSPIPSQAGTAPQDPITEWARDAFRQGSLPTTQQLAPGKQWRCQINMALKDMFGFVKPVPTYLFKAARHGKFQNVIHFEHEAVLGGRRYSPDEYDSHLSRSVEWGWYYSLAKDWANPEAPVPFRSYENLRFYRGRLIAERAMTARDLRRLSENHHDANEKFDAYSADPALARDSVDSHDPEAKLLAYQYLVCERPDAGPPSAEWDQPEYPSYNAWLAKVGLIRPEFARLACPAGTDMKPSRVLRIKWDSSHYLDLGEGWFINGSAARVGETVQLAPAMESVMKAMDGLGDNTGVKRVLELGEDYQIVRITADAQCATNRASASASLR